MSRHLKARVTNKVDAEEPAARSTFKGEVLGMQVVLFIEANVLIEREMYFYSMNALEGMNNQLLTINHFNICYALARG